MQDARRLAGKRTGRVGYLGTSKGGWVAPLAARVAPVDFVIVAYGLAVSVIDEDLQAIEREMRSKGHGPDEIARAFEVAKAVHVVVESKFTRGYAAFDALRALETPQLWVPGEDDFDAPSAETARLLGGLIDAGKPITIAMFPGAEHGMTEYRLAADGSRVSTRYAAGYFEILRAFARHGRVEGQYGRARVRTNRP